MSDHFCCGTQPLPSLTSFHSLATSHQPQASSSLCHPLHRPLALPYRGRPNSRKRSLRIMPAFTRSIWLSHAGTVPHPLSWSLRRRALTEGVTPPAANRAIGLYSAGVAETGADILEGPGWWIGLTEKVSASPAANLAIGPYSADVAGIGADILEGPGWLIGFIECNIPPAANHAISSYSASERDAGADGLERTLRG